MCVGDHNSAGVRGKASWLTLTFEALLGQAPQQGAAVLAEGGALVVVHLEAVRHVDLEAFFVDLNGHDAGDTEHTGIRATRSTNRCACVCVCMYCFHF